MTSSTSSGGLSGTITIGDLVALTGDLASQGARDQAAVNMAIRDINTWLNSTGAKYKFAVQNDDDATDTTTVLTDIETLAAKGITVYIGPEWSGGTTAILQYADTNHLVLLSESATAVTLAIPNDYLFRLIPDDAAQGQALAALINQEGIKAIAVIHRNDPYGNGLATAVESDFTALGGTVLVDQPYDTTATDYSTQLATTQTDVSQAVSQYGASHVAVELISFDEGGVILQQAASSYSSLLNVQWFGCDGEAQLDPFVTTAATQSLKVGLQSTLYSPGGSNLYNSFVANFTAYSGLSIQDYAAAAYDCVWVAALSIIAAGTTNGQKVQQEIIPIANRYYGPSGYPNLDAAGDKTIANYDIWGVQALPNGTATWNLVGTWSYATNVVTFTSGTTP